MRGDRIFDNFLSIFCQISILTPTFYVWNTFSFSYRTFSGRVMRENRHFWQFSVNFLSNLNFDAQILNFDAWLCRAGNCCVQHTTHTASEPHNNRVMRENRYFWQFYVNFVSSLNFWHLWQFYVNFMSNLNFWQFCVKFAFNTIYTLHQKHKIIANYRGFGEKMQKLCNTLCCRHIYVIKF